MLDIGESNPSKPVRVLIYGPEGVGKSSFGAAADSPIFITPEGGIDQLKAKYVRGMNSWDAVMQAIHSLTNEQHQFKTLVIDSADWLEKLSHAKIIGSSGLDIIRVNKGYGAGYREAERLHCELIQSLSALRDKVGMNVIITAHAHVKPVKDPSMLEDYDSHEIKCHEMVSSLYREWVDALLFARFRTFTKSKDTDRARAISDGSRVVYTVKQPSFQAKNRFGLPPEMEFTPDFWQEFMKHARKGVVEEGAGDIIVDIDALIAGVSEEIRDKAKESVVKAGNNLAKLKALRTRLKELQVK